MRHSGWIWISNLKPFLEILADFVSYELDEDDLKAVQFGIASSDGDATPERWFEYPLIGLKRLDLRLARDQGTDILRLEIFGPESLCERVSLVLDLLSRYRIT